MRIAIVHSFYRSSSPSGENIAVLAQAALLEKNGSQVKVFGVSSDDLTLSKKLKLPFNVAFFRGASLAEEVSRFNPDIVHVHNLFPNIGFSWLLDLKVPIVTTFHNFRPFCSNGLFMRDGKTCTDCLTLGSRQAVLHGCYQDSSLKSIPLSFATRASGSNHPLLNHSDRIIVLSPHSKEIYSAQVGDPERISQIENFSERLTPSDGTIQKSYWLYVGRLSQEKGIIELLEAWPPGKTLKVYGTGELDEYLKGKHGSNPDIEFMGFLTEAEKPEVFRGCVALVFPSTCMETSPLVMSEAFSIGIPILAFSQNVVGHLVKSSGGGVAFEDFSLLAESILDLEVNARDCSERAYELYEQLFSPQVWLRKIEDLYDDVLRQAK